MEEYQLMDIGKHLRSVRKSHKMLQKELAKLSGMDPSYISKLERGLADPSFSTLSRIASAYGLTPGHLLNYGQTKSYSMNIDAAIDALNTLKYNMVRVEINIEPL